jgi:hypothetical protein
MTSNLPSLVFVITTYQYLILQAGTKIFKKENQTQIYGFLLIIKHKKACISQKRPTHTHRDSMEIIKSTKPTRSAFSRRYPTHLSEK